MGWGYPGVYPCFVRKCRVAGASLRKFALTHKTALNQSPYGLSLTIANDLPVIKTTPFGTSAAYSLP